MDGSLEVRSLLVDTVTPDERRTSYVSAGQWTDATLSQRLREHARSQPERLAVADQDGRRRTTYAELDWLVDRAAAGLRARGVAAGSVVAVQLPNWLETVVYDLAVLRIGAVLNPLVTIYRDREINHMVAVAETTLLITPQTYRGFDFTAMAARIRAQQVGLEHVSVPDPASTTGSHFPEAAGDPHPAERRRPVSAVSMLLFSSGTEAAPKAIMHTEQTTGFGARAAAEAIGLTQSDVVWMPSPIGHSTGFNFGVRMALELGAALVLQDRWDAAQAVELVGAFECTYTAAAATFVRDVVARCRDTSTSLPSLRLFGTGGAPVESSLVAEADRFGMNVLRLYGSTEVLVATWNRPGSPLPERARTDGEPLPGVEVEVRDRDAMPVTGKPGEVFVRGPATSVGFLGDPERTAATFGHDGWVRSGDVGVLDEVGRLSIVGRVKEIVIRGGMNIGPREIEDLLAAHPAVAQIAVVGVPDERLGEKVCAVVVAHPGAEVSLPELTAYLTAAGLAPYKLPEQLVVVDSLPSTPSGKIQKHRILREILNLGPR